jgi:phytoene desaturase
LAQGNNCSSTKTYQALSKKIAIIGSGFAGLSAAAFMAKAGWEVSVIEKNKTAGGRAQQLIGNGFTFDMGPSWYWMPDVFERFFHQFNKKACDYYSLVRLDPSYRVYWEDDFTDIPADYNELKNLFERIENGSAIKLDCYLREAFTKYKIAIQNLVYKPGQSISEFFDGDAIRNILRLDVFTSIRSHVAKYFKHERLKKIMEFPVLFLGALPQDTPALYSLMNYADIVGGTWYPQGGMFAVVKAMQTLAEEQGARFFFEEEANEIVVEKKLAKKIVSSKNEYEADVIISAADYHFTEFNLLPRQHRTYTEAYWSNRVLAPSCLLYYVGLNKKLNNVLHHSLFFDVSFEKHGEEIYSHPQWPHEPLFYLSVSSRTDNRVAPADCENLVILVPVASGLKDDTEELRDFYFKAILRRLEKHTNQSISDAIIFKKTFSVSDFVKEYHSFKGNAYGLANVLKQTAILRPSCRSRKVKNLFYTGQFTVPGPGVPPALISGEVVSRQVLKYFNS